MEESDQETLHTALTDAADGCTKESRQTERDLVGWFEEQGNNVNEVDREAFRQAVVKLHNGHEATWDQETYDRLQAIE